MRDLDKNPYTPEEQRVAEYLVKLSGIGAGSDPIGFLIAAHQYSREHLKQIRKRFPYVYKITEET